MRRKLTDQQKEKKLQEWRKMYRKLHPRKVDWAKIADLDAETIAVRREDAEKLIAILKERNILFWPLGPLETVCSRPDHYREEES
jgi:hypothetical protein